VQKLAQAHHIHMLGALEKPVSPEQLRQVLASNALRSATRRGKQKCKGVTAHEAASLQQRVEVVAPGLGKLEIGMRRHPSHAVVCDDLAHRAPTHFPRDIPERDVCTVQHALHVLGDSSGGIPLAEPASIGLMRHVAHEAVEIVHPNRSSGCHSAVLCHFTDSCLGPTSAVR
jgi:hypothetical protein